VSVNKQQAKLRSCSEERRSHKTVAEPKVSHEQVSLYMHTCNVIYRHLKLRTSQCSWNSPIHDTFESTHFPMFVELTIHDTFESTHFPMSMELTNTRHISHIEFHRNRLRNIENTSRILFGFQLKMTAKTHTPAHQCLYRNYAEFYDISTSVLVADKMLRRDGRTSAWM
jgi:hypothetical protein